LAPVQNAQPSKAEEKLPAGEKPIKSAPLNAKTEEKLPATKPLGAEQPIKSGLPAGVKAQEKLPAGEKPEGKKPPGAERPKALDKPEGVIEEPKGEGGRETSRG